LMVALFCRQSISARASPSLPQCSGSTLCFG
jgi:hypothetical protein